VKSYTDATTATSRLRVLLLLRPLGDFDRKKKHLGETDCVQGK
jgi:hypothetical protein